MDLYGWENVDIQFCIREFWAAMDYFSLKIDIYSSLQA